MAKLCAALSLLLCLSLMLTGCGTKTKRRSHFDPYTVRGITYYPLRSAVGFKQQGIASWYGPKFHGKTTASGERYNQHELTCAHTILPFGTTIRVTNLENQHSILVRVNDRGPFVKNRVIDLSKAAATQLKIIGKGSARVFLEYYDKGQAKITGPKYIQVGAFENHDNSTRLSQDLSQGGFFGRTIESSPGLYLVQIGPFNDAQSLEINLQKVHEHFPQAFVVNP